MLLPKRVKYRKQFRGRMKGKAHRGNTVSHGEFGLVALEPAWITNRQIEAARIAMTRYIKRGVLGLRRQARSRALRDERRIEGSCHGGHAPCRPQAADPHEVRHARGVTESSRGR